MIGAGGGAGVMLLATVIVAVRVVRKRRNAVTKVVQGKQLPIGPSSFLLQHLWVGHVHRCAWWADDAG